jgi:hypothetical protein
LSGRRSATPTDLILRRRESAVSKDRPRASWFETALRASSP